MWKVEHKASRSAKWRTLAQFKTEAKAIAYAAMFDPDGIIMLPYRVRFDAACTSQYEGMLSI